MKRANVGLEFCGISQALDTYDVQGRYTFYIFVNTSIRGPFMPNYMAHLVAWTTFFQRMLNSNTKLVGVSINCHCGNECLDALSPLQNIHVQSFLLATDSVGLAIIRPALQCFDAKIDAVDHGEVAISRLILKEGYNIASMDKFWFGHNFSDVRSTKKMCGSVAKTNAFNGDMQYQDAYFGMTHNPFESVFIKTNRGVRAGHSLYTRWSDVTSERKECGSLEEIECAARDIE